MPRPPKSPRLLLVEGNALCSVSKDGVFDPEAEDADETLFDTVEAVPADELLFALRRSFSLSFPRNPFIDGLQQALLEVRRIGVEALKPHGKFLEDLKLPPVPLLIDDPSLNRAQVFIYLIARTSDLQRSVTSKGRRHRLLNLVEHHPADPLLRAMRQIVSATFAEVHNEEQHEDLLREIRLQAFEALRRLNKQLLTIEVEPIVTEAEYD